MVRCAAVLLAALLASGAAAQDPPALRDQAAQALRKAAGFFRGNVATRGGYLWFYSADLQQRWGEGRATAGQVWVQPPGTPAVGEAYLAAYEATRDAFYLEAAREAAGALLYGQLRSGGWTHSIDFAPDAKARAAYRGGDGRGRNVSSLDDDTSQAACRFLMRFDRLTDFKDAKVHEAVGFALDALLKAQFANGGFPQGWAGPAEERPVIKASIPETWSMTYPPGRSYWFYYTLNDGLAGSVCEVLLDAHATTQDAKYLDALKKLGDFLLLAQLPDPQPGWAQQYDPEMHPAWARKFEPPAVTGGESQDAMRCLLRIFEATGDAKYLEPLPRALAYFRGVTLPGDRLARFYELRTGKPLYFTKEYVLTTENTDLPEHYAFTIPSRLDAIEREYQKLKAGEKPKPSSRRAPDEAAVRKVIAELDAEGRWVEEVQPARGVPTGRYLRCRTFIDNVETLSSYLAATR